MANTHFSPFLPHESIETGPLPHDLMAGYLPAVKIVQVAASVEAESLMRLPEVNLWFLTSCLKDLAIGDVDDVFKALTANSQEINSVRDHPVSYWGIVFPNAHLVCMRLWDRLLYAAWDLARQLGLESGLCCEDRWDFDVFDLSVFKGHERAARDHFARLGLQPTELLLTELQMEVSKVAQRRRDARQLLNAAASGKREKVPLALANGSRSDFAELLEFARQPVDERPGECADPEPTRRVILRGREEGPIVFGSDFHSCRWGSERFTFTGMQAACVRVLWEARQRGTPAVRGITVLDEAESAMADSTKPRLRDLFRNHPAWRKMIVSASRGTYRLADPPA
jgi:hypothetical protein